MFLSDQCLKPNVSVIALGAILKELRVGPDRINVVLGFDSPRQYREHNAPFFGETIGRLANRVAGAEIRRLNGQSYKLDANDGPNCLHGGQHGWGKRLWDGPTLVERRERAAQLFRYLSNDGDGGCPGDVEAKVWYMGYQDGDATVLDIEYEAELTGPEGVNETAINMTNHSYFNIGDSPSIEGTEVTLSTDLHLPIDETGIPKGDITPFPGVTAQRPFILGAEEPKIDHCFVLESDQHQKVPIDTRSSPLKLLASFSQPKTGIRLEISSTEPAFQFYTGEHIDAPGVGSVPSRGPRSGFAVEPCRYINAVNVDEWRNMVLLRKGDKYGSLIRYKVWQSAGS